MTFSDYDKYSLYQKDIPVGLKMKEWINEENILANVCANTYRPTWTRKTS